MLSVLGAFISTAWFLIILRAHRYEDEWLFRARWLQRRLAIAPNGAIWQEPGSPFRPGKELAGISSYDVLIVLISGFFFMWVGIMTASLYLGSLCNDARIILSVIAAILGIFVYVCVFWLQLRKAKKYLKFVEEALGP